jgi:hypothetical protein
MHEYRVRYFRMKKITLTADAGLIEQARLVARARHKTLNEAFREWLRQFTAQSAKGEEIDSLLKRLRHVNAGRPFNCDEMNER